MTKTQYNSKPKSASFWSWILCFMFLVGMWTTGAQAQTYTVVPTGGTAGNTNGTGSDPIDDFYNFLRYQVVYTAAELSAAGLSSGMTITDIGWNVTEAPGTLSAYTMRMGTTTASNSAAHDASALTTVKNAFTYVPTVGWNMITLDVPFIWDGSSNLLIDICTGSNPYSSPYGGVQAKTGVTSGSRFKRCDGCGSQCSVATNSTLTTKPYLGINATAGSPCSGTPAPGNTLSSASPVCATTSFNLSLQNIVSGSGITYQWQSSPDGSTWTNFGTSAPSQSVTQSTATYYQCIVTCTNSGLSATSAPVQVLQNLPINCYCTPTSTSATYGITNFTTTGGVTNINNTSTGGQGYVNNTAQVVSQLQGSSVNFSYTVVPTEGVGIWIDWNQNGSFLDAGEQVYNAGSYVSSGSGTISVLLSQPAGNYRMRIVGNWLSTSPTPCGDLGSAGYGEAEDYTFTVIPLSNCSGTPAPGNTLSNPATACIGQNINLSLQNSVVGAGITFDWQSSPDGVTWTSTGGTLPSYTTTQSAATWYQCIVTCTYSGQSATSTPVQVLQNSFLTCYCTSSATSTGDEDILNVTFGALNNSSTCATTGGGPGSTLNMYSNYTSGPGAPATPIVVQGNAVPFSIQVGTCGSNYNNMVKIFIDWNQNGLLTDVGEEVYVSPTYTSGPHTETGTVIVPLTAATGVTLMRVVNVETTSALSINPCGTYGYGETEDYLINVTVASGCTGTPAASVTTSSSTNVCPSGSFTLNTSPYYSDAGLTFDWQSSPDGITYSSTGIITQSYPVSGFTATTWYQCVVTCTNSGLSTTSTPVQVSLNPFYNCYCTANLHTFSTPCINEIDLNTLSNNTAAAGCALPAYSFQSATTNVLKGSTYTFTRVASGTGAWTGLWIDYDHSGTFDASEYTEVSNTSTGALTNSISLTIPMSALSGNTGMRIRQRTVDMTAADACTQNFGSGETEDYVINLVNPNPCSGTPAPGATVSSGNPACFIDAITLSTQNLMTDLGLTFNWLTSPDGVTWTSTGVTTPTMTVNQSAATYYMVAVTCTNSGLSGNSTPLLVNQTVCYCTTPYYSYNSGYDMCVYYNYIGNVTFAGINNSTVCDNTPPYYNYYSSQTATVNRTGSYPITISATAGGASFQLYKVYIDFNDNGSFDDAGEMVYTSGFISSATNYTTGTIVIPNTAPLGTHRMRVRSTNPLNTNIDANSCSDDGYLGEVEDYNILINPAPPCSGTPTPGATLSDKALVCSSTTINLSLQNTTPGLGVTYQWQSSADVAFTTPVNLGTAATQTATQTTTTYYRCLVTCSGNTGISTPVLVSSTTACYCTNPTTGSNGCALGLYIDNVTFAGINNTSGCFSPVPYTTPFYSFFPSQVATAQQGNTYAFSASAPNNPGSYYQWYGVWIDYNDNGSFDDAGELVLSSVAGATTLANALTGNITIPLTATVGQHLMRVRTGNVQVAINSCSDNSVSGEVEDYLIDITAAPNCSTPAPGNTISSVTSTCPSENINLSLQNNSVEIGLIYQWQVSTAGAGGPWTNVGTNANTFTATQTVASWYQCVVTCTFGGATATSTPVQVTMNPIASCYCVAGATTAGCSSGDEYIGNVTLNTINNTSTCQPSGTQYTDFTAISTNLKIGDTYVASVLTPNYFSGDQAAIWIDFNQNGTFEVPAEQFILSGGASGVPFTGNITIPGSALTGNTRMRVRMAYSGTLAPCGIVTYGEVEDYTVNISPPTCVMAPTYPADAGSGCADAVTGNITLSWPALLGATGYDVYFGTVNPPVTMVSFNQIGLTYDANVVSGNTYYWMIVPQISGGGSSCNVWSFSVSPSPVPVAGSGGDVCLGNDIFLSADNVDPGQLTGNTYSWTGPNSFTSSLQYPSISSPNATYSGTYTVIVTNQYGCTASASTSLNVNDNPTLTIDSLVNVSCAGGSDGILYTSAAGGLAPYGYTSDFINFNSTGVMGNLATGATTVYVSDGNGCQAQIVGNLTAISTAPPSQSVVVTPTIIGMPAYACPGTTANLSIPAVAGATKYIWDGPFGTYFNGNPMNQSPYTTTTPSVQITFSSSTSSFVSIGVQAANGCGASLRKIQKVRYQISTPKEITGATTMCANTNGTYTIAPVTDATGYQWMITGNATVVPSGTSVVVFFGPGWNGGNLCVAAKTPCYTTAYKCMYISKSASALNAITGPLSSCPNEVQTFSITPCTGAASYNWTLPAGVTGNSTTNSITATFGPTFTHGGNICVSVTSICGVTSAPKCRTVAQGLPSVPTSISGITNGLCNQSVNYTVPSSPGVTYNWTAPGSISGNGNSSVNVTYGALTTGQLCVTASNSCGTSAARCIPLKGSPNSPIGLTAIPASWCANTQGIEFTADIGNTTGSYTLSWGYPSSPTATYVAGGGNSNALTLDWGTGNGSVVVNASNGCGTGSKAFAVTIGCKEGELASANRLNVYPNPTAGVLNVEYTAEKGNAQVTVLDLSGRVVMTQTQANVTGQNTLQLDLSKVAKGAYMLNVQTNGSNNQVRVVVE
ncbi:MAG: GEVED domain-containing protein [Bacteroidia bacterium]